jgi:tetratricopeptide (TPR) repeat protein
MIVKNPYIKNLKFIPNYFDPLHTKTGSVHDQQRGIYRPLLLVSFALNYHISGLNPFSYHLFNIILHVLNGLLVYITINNVLLSLGEAEEKKHQYMRIAFTSALLFVCHPLQTESVSYIVSRSSLLSTFFILCSFLSFLYSLKIDRYRLTFRIASIMCLAFGLLTKEIVIVLPMIVLIYTALHLYNKKEKRILLSSMQISVPYFIILFLYLLVRILTVDRIYLSGVEEMIIYYFLTSLKAFFIYLKLFINPLDLNVDHDLPIVKTIWDPSALLAFFSILLYYCISSPLFFRYSKTLFLFSLWFLIALLPTMFIPSGEPISEHTIYFPSIGFFAAVMILVIKFWHYIGWYKSKEMKTVGLALFYAMIMIMGFMTIDRNHAWQDDISLWSDAVKKSPNRERPHNNLGLAYMNINRLDLAFDEFQLNLSINPKNSDAMNNIGIIWAVSGNFEKAKEAFTDSINMKAYNPDALNNLGFLYIQFSKYELSIPILKKVIEIIPNDFTTNANLGLAYCQTNDRVRGCHYLQNAKRINPDYERGILLYKQFCMKNEIIPSSATSSSFPP